jgi:hypothetical protein
LINQRAGWVLAVAVVATSACTPREAPGVTKELELGPHRIQVSAPAGWDVLDQGAQKRFRKGELEIVLQNLGRTQWDPALAALSDNERREVKSRNLIMIDNHEAQDVETWNRLDHTWPQRLLFVRVDDDLLALRTPRQADDETLKAFASIRDSLHFTSSVRR